MMEKVGLEDLTLVSKSKSLQLSESQLIYLLKEA